MGRVSGFQQVVAGVGPHRPVVVLARAVYARKRLLVQKADQPVAAGHVLHDLHRQLLVVGAHIGVLEHGRDLVLVRRDLVVAGLDRHAELRELPLGIEHAREDPFGDRTEVVVIELVALGRLSPEQGPPGGEEIGALEVELLVDQEVLLLGSDGGEDPPGVRVPEQPQCPDCRPRERVHRAQQRNLVVERLAGPGGKRGGDAQHRAVGVLEDEGGRSRIPRGIAARLERGPNSAGGERRGVRFALDQLLARELGQRGPLAGRTPEAVVLFGGRAGEWLKPVGVVGCAALERPRLHRLRHGVRERSVERLSTRERLLQPAEDVLRQPLPLHRDAEHIGPEDLVVRGGQIGCANGAPVGRPLSGEHGLLADSRHASRSSFDRRREQA